MRGGSPDPPRYVALWLGLRVTLDFAPRIRFAGAAAADLGFGPVIAPEDFRAAFVARDGWGTFAQKLSGSTQTAALAPTHGSVTVRTLRLRPLVKVKSVSVTLGDRPVEAAWAEADGDCRITLADALTVRAGQGLKVTLT